MLVILESPTAPYDSAPTNGYVESDSKALSMGLPMFRTRLSTIRLEVSSAWDLEPRQGEPTQINRDSKRDHKAH